MLDSRFRDEDMDSTLDCIEGYGVVGRVRSENVDSIAWRERVDGGFVEFWVPRSLVGRDRIKGDVEVIVHGGDVLLEMFA